MTLSITDPSALDRAYNNRALVPEHVDYFERWARQSAQVRATHPCSLDIPYGAEQGETLDIFSALPTASLASSVPVLVFIHGGYWRSLDKSEHSFLAPAFTATGVCVVVVNYALCPGTPEAPISVLDIGRQMETALGWVARNIQRYGGDPRRITVAGHSAGGQLAALMLTVDAFQHPPGDGVRNGLSISGLHDLEPIRQTPFLQSVLNLTQQQVLQTSPALRPAPVGSRLFVVAGGDESEAFWWQARAIEAAWGAHAVPRCQILPGLNHFSIVDALVQPGHPLHQMALELLHA